MSEGTKEQMQMPKHGEFCWTEIATTGLEESVNFYRDLFGWKISKTQNEEVPIDYREFDTGLGQSSGGMYEMTQEMFEEEIPPSHFLNYVAVDDVDASAKKVVELGGTVTVKPHDIPNTGRMVVVQDPTGATLALITLKNG